MKNKDNVNILSKRYPPFKKKKISHILIFFSNPLLLIKFFFLFNILHHIYFSYY